MDSNSLSMLNIVVWKDSGEVIKEDKPQFRHMGLAKWQCGHIKSPDLPDTKSDKAGINSNSKSALQCLQVLV